MHPVLLLGAEKGEHGHGVKQLDVVCSVSKRLDLILSSLVFDNCVAVDFWNRSLK